MLYNDCCQCSAGDAAIRKLNLTGNNIGDKGATLLAEMLKVVFIPFLVMTGLVPTTSVPGPPVANDSYMVPTAFHLSWLICMSK